MATTLIVAPLFQSTLTGHARALRAIPAILLILLLPSCFTSQLWEMDSWGPHLTKSEHTIDESVAVRIATDAPTPFMMMSTNADDFGDLRITPRVKGRAAAALMQRPELFTIETAKLTGAVRSIDGRSHGDKGKLRLTGKLNASGWRRDVNTNDLPTTVQQHLAVAAIPQTQFLPLALHRCADLLLAGDPAILFPDAGKNARIANFVFATQAGETVPFHGNGTATTGTFDFNWYEQQVDGYKLYATLAGGRANRTLEIDPINFWIAAGLTAHAGMTAHESEWHMQAVPGSDLITPDKTNLATIDAHLQLRTLNSHRPSSTTRVAQIALTPITLVADVVIGIPLFIGFFLFVDSDQLC